MLINSILGSLVAVTACCAVCRPWEAFVIGSTGGIITVLAIPLLDMMHIDDPVGAISVHGISGIWGMLMVGIFANNDTFEHLTYDRAGLVHGGGFYLLGVQALASVVIAVWSAVVSFILLFAIDKTIGMRLSEEDELLGADVAEHEIHYENHTMPPSVMGVHDECMSPISAIFTTEVLHAAEERLKQRRLSVPLSTIERKVAWKETLVENHS